MNPISRRRVARRRLIAEWAARANRLFGGEAPAAGTEAVQTDADERSREPVGSEAAARRLPFELLDPPAVASAEPPGSNGQGSASVAEPAGVEPGSVGTALAAPVAEPPPAVEARAAETPPEEHLYQAARHAAEQRDPIRAAQLYRQVLEINPDHVRARNNLALVLDERGEHEEALEHLNRCRRQEPQSVELLINRSAVLGALGQYPEAERDLRTVLEREPSNPEAYFNLGLVASRRGRWREAVTHLRQAVELDGGQAAAYCYLGEALNHVDDLPGALQAYQRAVELKPTNPKALYGMGIVLDRMNRPDEAAPLYRRSRELKGK